MVAVRSVSNVYMARKAMCLTVAKLAAEAAISILLDELLTTGSGGGGIAVPIPLLTELRLPIGSDTPLMTECR